MQQQFLQEFMFSRETIQNRYRFPGKPFHFPAGFLQSV
jgi:hypothetical protein